MAKNNHKKAEVSDLPLDQQLQAKRNELISARQDLGSTLQNPHIISKIRRDIARILTKINSERKIK
jgi:ribosomal protein L29